MERRGSTAENMLYCLFRKFVEGKKYQISGKKEL